MRKVLGIVFGVIFFCLAFTGTGYATTNNADTYTVQPGDTFYLIALQYGMSADQLMAANGDTSSDLYPGQVLTIPQVNGNNNQQPNQYTVVAGDTLFQIAQEYGMTLDALVALNHLTPDKGDVDINPGQVLQLPGIREKRPPEPAVLPGTGSTLSDPAIPWKKSPSSVTPMPLLSSPTTT